MSFGYFVLTDGTTSVPLLSSVSGYSVDDWRPQAASFKNDGVWMDSAMGEGRRPVMAKFANITDSVKLMLNAQNQDLAIRHLQDLRRLGKKARDYWQSPAQTEPVWIEARGGCETNTRYALVYAVNLPDEQSPFVEPFAATPSALTDLTASIEHAIWMDTAPGSYTCLPIASEYPGWQHETTPTSAGAWDASDFGGAISPAVNYLGSWPPGNPVTLGVIFTLNVPKNARILAAWVEFTAATALAGNTVNCAIRVEETDSAVAFSTHADFIARPVWGSIVPWSAIPAQAIGDHIQTPDVTSLVQHIVDRSGWVAGNKISFMIADGGSTAGASRNEYTQTSTNYRPQLYVLYEPTPLDGIDYPGQSKTCTQDECYVANFFNPSLNLTHGYVYDAGTATFLAGDLMTYALPCDLLPTAPAIGDILYLGISSTVMPTAQFLNIVFNIDNSASWGGSGVWEYWNGAWVTINGNLPNGNTFDKTNGLRKSGPNVISFAGLQNAAQTTINGVLAYWIRFRVTSGNANKPRAVARPYVCNWNMLTVDGSDIPGDIEALVRLSMRYRGSGRINDGSGLTYSSISRIIMGTRALKRGNLFVSNFNASDYMAHLPPHFQTGENYSVAGVISFANVITPVGRCLRITPNGTAIAEENIITWTPRTGMTDNDIGRHYSGKYRVFLRYSVTAGRPSILVRFTANSTVSVGAIIASSTPLIDQTPAVELRVPAIYPAAAAPVYQVEELGTITIEDDPDRQLILFGLSAEILNSTVGDSVNIYDVVLVPSDEYYADFYCGDKTEESLYGLTGTAQTMLDVNSFVTPRSLLFARLSREVDGNLIDKWKQIAVSPPLLSPDIDTRIFFLMMNYDSSDTPYGGEAPFSHYHSLLSAQAWRNARYFSGRGDR